MEMKYKPCPFCGTDDAYFVKDGQPSPTPIVNHDEKKKIRFVACEKCGARGPVSQTHEDAVLHWNQRSDT